MDKLVVKTNKDLKTSFSALLISVFYLIIMRSNKRLFTFESGNHKNQIILIDSGITLLTLTLLIGKRLSLLVSKRFFLSVKVRVKMEKIVQTSFQTVKYIRIV